MNTVSANPQTVKGEWYIVDATDMVLGRLATQVATLLRGKHKPDFTPHVDMGDHVVVINAEKIRVTGNKVDGKKYYRHTGYPGGIKETTFGKLRDAFPERPVEKAVKGMLPRNTLGRQLYRKLKVYAGSEHPHSAQQPKAITLRGDKWASIT